MYGSNRKISRAAAAAFENGRPFTRSNTRVRSGSFLNQAKDEWFPYWILELHGSSIARYPLDGSWHQDGEVRHCGWLHTQVTKDRLNALSGVSAYTAMGYCWLNKKPWIGGPKEWSPKEGSPPEKVSRRVHKAREFAVRWVAGHALSLRYPQLRQRQYEPIFCHHVEMQWGTVEMLYRPWAKKPGGEFMLGRRKDQRIYFPCWKDFPDAVERVNAEMAPDLMKLARAAAEILEEK
jgi:hypothetical protein